MWTSRVQLTKTSNSACDTGVLRAPVAHNETLEAKLRFQDIVQQLRVLTRIRIVGLVVRAHYSADPSAHGVGERPDVKLVEGLVVNVGRERLGDVETIAGGLSSLPEVLFL